MKVAQEVSFKCNGLPPTLQAAPAGMLVASKDRMLGTAANSGAIAQLDRSTHMHRHSDLPELLSKQRYLPMCARNLKHLRATKRVLLEGTKMRGDQQSDRVRRALHRKCTTQHRHSDLHYFPGACAVIDVFMHSQRLLHTLLLLCNARSTCAQM